MKLVYLSACLSLLTTNVYAQLARDASGWSVVPANLQVKKYVSASKGKDTNPGTQQAPHKTLKHAFSQLSDGTRQEALYLDANSLFSKDSFFLKPDGVRNAPHILTGYGSQNCPRLTDVQINSHHGGGNSDGTSDLAFLGLCMNSAIKDPQSPQYNLSKSNEASNIFIYATTKNILIEAMKFRFTGFAIQGPTPGAIQNAVIRRNVITDNYSIDSHAQGIYGSGILGATVEENIMDHNGWLIKSKDNTGMKKEGGQATMFNHNTYLTNVSNMTIQKNVFMRPSSIHNKFTSQPKGSVNEVNSSNNKILNNFYYDGEIMISAGGNTDYNNGPRFDKYTISQNVFSEAGLSRPTNRVLAWGVDVNDWKSGEVSGNIFTNFVPGNIYHLKVAGETSNVLIDSNIFHHGQTTESKYNSLVTFAGTALKSIRFQRNEIQAPNSQQILISIDQALVGKVQFSNNVYYSLNPKPFKIGTKQYTFAEWKALTGDTSVFSKIAYTDASRSFAKYATLNKMSLSQVFTHIRGLTKSTFLSSPIRADKINEYFRQGFDVGR